ncbi:MAG: hypothetical protein U1D30_13295 [Planctomycetota bacterium]
MRAAIYSRFVMPVLAIVPLFVGNPARLNGAEIPALIATFQEVGPEGKGNAAAAQAWRELAAVDGDKLPELLAGLDKSSPLAANWIHGAIDAVAERSLREGKPLPARDLESFLLDTSHDPKARRLAFEWLSRVDDSAPDRLIPGMLNDPSVELRRDAVQRLVDQAEKVASEPDDKAKSVDRQKQVVALYQQAMTAARDEDQIKQIAKRLTDLGQKVDLPKHYGFLMEWKLIGPFDNTQGKGFAAVFPPEEKLDLIAEYEGKGQKVRWQDHATSDDYGKVNLNKALGPFKGATAYAVAKFTSDQEQPVEIRLGSINAWKVWLNGKLLFGHEEYHSGTKLDQNRLKGMLRKGENTILLKVCQNEQTESWAQDWEFQLRVCDSVGTAILSTTRPARKPDAEQQAASR